MFAASSLVDVFNEAGPAFETATPAPGVRVTISVTGSQILAAQLLEGAGADVFASADRHQMDRVADLFLAPIDFATNRLVIIAHSSVELERAEELAAPGLRVVIASDSVPAGRYALEAMEQLDEPAAIESNIVSYEHDVRGVLTKVLLGEADAGIVYATDAVSAPEGALRVIELPAEASVSATYPIAVHRDARDAALARSFVEFLRTGEGATILRQHGFEVP